MKILFLAPEPFFEIRGTPLNVKAFLEVIGQGNRVDLLTYHIGEDVDIRGVKIYRIPGVFFIKSVPIGASLAKVFLDILLFLKAGKMLLRKKYDVIHAVEESAFFAAFLGAVSGTPFIYDMDSCISDQLSHFSLLKGLLGFVRYVERLAIRRAAVVVTVCRALTEKVKALRPGKRVFQIEDAPMGSDREGQTDLRGQFGLGSNRVIIYTGNFEGYQGLELLLRCIPAVAARRGDVRFVLVGGRDDQIQKMKELAGSLGVLQWLVFAGRREPEEIPAFLGMADILASPRLEGVNTPFKIFEYLASGKPIVATDLPSHNQLLSVEEALLVEPTPEGLSKGMLTLLDDKDMSRRIGLRGKKLLEENYSRAHFSEKVRELYEFVACNVCK